MHEVSICGNYILGSNEGLYLMRFLRPILPWYLRIIKKLSKGRGYGKLKSVRFMLKLFDKLFRSDVVTVMGHKMMLPKRGFDEYSTLGVYGEFDTQTVEKYVIEGDYVVDVGAAIGYYTLILARAVGPNGKVFAFEPKKERFDLLKKNIELNGYHNVVLENKAILPLNTTSLFFDSGIGGLRLSGMQSKHVIIPDIDAVDLDSYFIQLNSVKRISFIKIDVDGPEMLVLKSASMILKNSRLKILMEWDKKTYRLCDCDPSETVNILEKNGFRILYPDYSNNRYFQVSTEEILKLDSNNVINVFCTKDAI